MPLEKLKPCPFCGKKPKVHFQLDDIGDYRVQCRNCGASTGEIVYSKKEAIENWNKRSDK